MPKEMTHWWVARRARQELDPKSGLSTAIDAYRQIYAIGAVVPDMPFYLLFGPRSRVMNRLAEHIHNPESGSYLIFKEFLPFMGIDRRNAALALLSGVLTHIHTDSIFHPMVYYFCGLGGANFRERKYSLFRHRTLETLTDVFVRYRFDPDGRGRFSELLRGLEVERKVFLELLETVFSPFGKVNQKQVRRMIRYQGWIQGLFFQDFFRILPAWPS